MKCTIFGLALLALLAGRAGEATAQVYNNLATTTDAGIENGSITTITGDRIGNGVPGNTNSASDSFSLTQAMLANSLSLDLFFIQASSAPYATLTGLQVTITDNQQSGDVLNQYVSTTLGTLSSNPVATPSSALTGIDINGTSYSPSAPATQFNVTIDLGTLVSLNPTQLNTGPPLIYTLTLSDASGTDSSGYHPTIDWEINASDTPSGGANYGPSMSFAIFGTADQDAIAGTPEPGSLAMMGMTAFSFAGYFGMRRRKRLAMA
jgi:hypothetical protein